MEAAAAGAAAAMATAGTAAAMAAGATVAAAVVRVEHPQILVGISSFASRSSS